MSGGGGGNRNRLVIGLNLVTCWHLHSPQSPAFYLRVLAFTDIHYPIGQGHHCTKFMFPSPCREGLSNLLSLLIHFSSTLGAMEYLYTFLKPFWGNREMSAELSRSDVPTHIIPPPPFHCYGTKLMWYRGILKFCQLLLEASIEPSSLWMTHLKERCKRFCHLPPLGTNQSKRT